MHKITEYNINSMGCIAYKGICPYAEDCLVGIAQFDECITNIEIEDTAKIIMHSLTAMLFDEYGIDLMSEDYKHTFQMLKNYVLETKLIRDDILDIQYETHDKIIF